MLRLTQVRSLLQKFPDFYYFFIFKIPDFQGFSRLLRPPCSIETSILTVCSLLTIKMENVKMSQTYRLLPYKNITVNSLKQVYVFRRFLKKMSDFGEFFILQVQERIMSHISYFLNIPCTWVASRPHIFHASLMRGNNVTKGLQEIRSGTLIYGRWYEQAVYPYKTSLWFVIYITGSAAYAIWYQFFEPLHHRVPSTYTNYPPRSTRREVKLLYLHPVRGNSIQVYYSRSDIVPYSCPISIANKQSKK